MRPDRYFWILLILFPLSLAGQNTLITEDTIRYSGSDTLRLSHRWLADEAPQLFLGDVRVNPESYRSLPVEGLIILRFEPSTGASFRIRYRYFPRFLDASYYYRSLRPTEAKIQNGDFPVSSRYLQERESYPEVSSLKKSGSLSRGVTVGNRQDLSVTSGMRLQVEGDVGDGIKIAAAVTDENIPIQPDGTTQQIQDFDKVFVQLSKGRNQMILGDFEINQTGTQFANFYRNLQGIRAMAQQGPVTASASAAVAKGKFHTNSFQGQEGVQGPYRLTGKNNERFIIVLAGSEKVYLNGKMVQRGEGNDYTIDYNTGELYFTSQQVISSASRIVVDFEYSDRYYNRSLMFGDVGIKALKDKFSMRMTYGRDADNQNAPIDLNFSEQDRQVLRLAGDNAAVAVAGGVDSTGYVTNAIRYMRSDTVIDSVSYERYVLSSDPILAVYDITFSFVGPGQGNYVKADNLVNGTWYRWVAPDSLGNETGDYAPVQLLSLPRLLQVVDLGAEMKFNDKLSLYSEGALSSEDKNRFSNLDDKDNLGFANRTGIRMNGVRIADSLLLRAEASHKIVDQRYQNIDRINKVEYGREWNFDDKARQQTENVTEGLVELNWRRRYRLLANAGIRSTSGGLFSTRQVYEAESQGKLIKGKNTFSYITTKNDSAHSLSVWARNNGDVYAEFWKLKLGSEIWIEDKQNSQADSLASGSFRFYDFKPYLKSNRIANLEFITWYNYRREMEYGAGAWRNKSYANTEYMKIAWTPSENISLQNTSSFRDFRVQDSLFVSRGLTNNQTLITNFQANLSAPKKWISANALYEVTSERLARKEVAYLAVNSGNGQYVWIDKNENGLQELDEFQESPNAFGNYIRVVIPTRTLYPTTTVNTSGNLRFEPKNLIKKSDNLLSEAARNFSAITNFRLSQKKNAGNEWSNYFIEPGKSFSDTSLLEGQSSFRQEAWMFRNNPVGEIKGYWSDSRSRTFLATGHESRGLRQGGSEQRLNLGKSKSIENEVKLGNKLSKVDQLPGRDYDIRFWEVYPRMNFQVSRKVRISFGYQYKDKVNRDTTGAWNATVNIHKLSTEAKLNLKGRNNINSKFELVYVVQNGTPPFTADFEMKESLGKGLNAVIQTFVTFYPSKNLELSLNYDGRIRSNTPSTHSGRVQLKAFF